MQNREMKDGGVRNITKYRNHSKCSEMLLYCSIMMEKVKLIQSSEGRIFQGFCYRVTHRSMRSVEIIGEGVDDVYSRGAEISIGVVPIERRVGLVCAVAK